jgi:HSP20 family protein
MSGELQNPETQIDPWTDFDRVFDAVRSRVLGAWAPNAADPAFAPHDGRLFRPARTDVSETGTAYKIVVEVPGIPKDKLDIRLRGTSLEIRGENDASSDTKDGEFMHRERTYAGYFRRLELPEPVVASQAKAKVENGVLELELPKEHPAPESSEVKVAVQ